MSNDAMEIKLRAVVEGMDAAKAQVNDLLNEAEKMPQRVQTIGAAADTMGSKLETAFGGSSRAVNQFGNAIASVVPLPGQLSYAIDLLIDSGVKAAATFGAFTLAVMAVGKVIEEGAKATAAAKKIYDDYADSAERAAKAKYAPQSETNDANVKAGLAKYEVEMDALKKQYAEERKNVETLRNMGDQGIDFGESTAKGMAKAEEKLRAVEKAMDAVAHNMQSLKTYGTDAANMTVTFRDDLVDLAGALDSAAYSMANYQRNLPNRGGFGMGSVPTAEDMIAPTTAGFTRQTDIDISMEPWKQSMERGAQAAAQAYGRELQAQAEAFHASLVGKAEGMLQVSQVTAQDLADTAAGKYKDKNDENIRRLRLYPEIDSEIFRKLPQQIQEELKTAMESGGAGAYRLKISDLIQSGESFGDSRLWDVDKMANDLRAQVEAENNKKRLAEEVVARSGLDKNNSTVMAQANKLSGADPTGVGGIMDGAKKTIEEFRPANSLTNAFQSDKDNIIKAGRKMGEFIVSGLRDQIVDAVDDISTSFMKSLTGSLDGRYVRQAKTFGGLQ